MVLMDPEFASSLLTTASNQEKEQERTDATPDVIVDDVLNEDDNNGLGWDDFKLPESTITKIIKEVIPPSTIISKDGKSVFREIAVLFISYITESASAIATSKKRKTLLPADVLDALREYNFDFLLPKLENLLEERHAQTSGKSSHKPDEQINNDEQAVQDEEPKSEDASLSHDINNLSELVREMEHVIMNEDLPNQTATTKLKTGFMDSDDED